MILKQTLCNKFDQLLQKLDTKKSDFIQFLKPDNGVKGFQLFNENNSSYQALLKQYCLTVENGNQTSLVSLTSAVIKTQTRQ